MFGTYPYVAGEVWAGVRYSGDIQAGVERIGLVIQQLQLLKNLNIQNLPLYQTSRGYDDGSQITVFRQGNVYSAAVYVPPKSTIKIPALEKGQVYWIPGCVARYDAAVLSSLAKSDALHWINSIPTGTLSKEVLRYRSDVSLSARQACGLPVMQSMPEAGITRDGGVFKCSGGVNSGMYLSKEHMPDEAIFSFSCAFRLHKKLEYDYTFDEKGVLNPVRPYYLKKNNGGQWTWDCPGSLSPVIGWASPQYFTADYEKVTFPWSPWNDDFTKKTSVTGLKAVDIACADAPLLADSSPYWDKKDPPNAYPYPKGFIVGMRFCGLFIYNGNQLLCGRINDFTKQYQLSPIITSEISLGQWFHAVVVQGKNGTLNLFLANGAAKDTTQYTTMSQIQSMTPPTVYDSKYDYVFLGYNSWDINILTTNERISHFSMNPQIDICIPRFYRRDLTKAEALLLHVEAFGKVFIADDFELGPLEATGFSPVTV